MERCAEPGRRSRIVVVGLGNPGKHYARHRHNIGFMVVDRLASIGAGPWRRDREKALTTQIRLEGFPLVLVKPQTYMNLSGKAVAPILGRVRADPAAMIVIHDDLDLQPGAIRVKSGGGDGGHRGIRSIADSLRFRDFIRLRLGIGRPPEGTSAEEFVLSPFPAEDSESLAVQIEGAVRAVGLVLTLGVEKARNTINSQKISAEPKTAGL